ncbi:MAG: VOC family protein [Acidobacteria bacterium]|nr:VOC family protein [Acidobacteriota bacterium]
MSFAHLTLPTRDVERTARFFEKTLGYARRQTPANSPVDAQWLDLGRDQQVHVVRVAEFEASPFEGEFGRHVAVRYPLAGFDALKTRLRSEGAEVFAPLRATPFERFFFRDPVNGFVFEVLPEQVARPE